MWINKFLRFFIFLYIFAAGASQPVLADSWWGEGYREPEWVLSHGGTIIYFEISGKGSSENYKAVLEQGGKYAEGEIGKKGKFDDAKNGKYAITAYKGGTDNRNGKTGKKIASIEVSARPGETIRLYFSEEDKSASLRSDHRPADKKPVAASPETPPAAPEPLTQPIVIPESVKKNWEIS